MGDVDFWPWCWMPKQPWALRRPVARVPGGAGHGAADGFTALLAMWHGGSGEAKESGRPPSTTRTLLPGGPLRQGHLKEVRQDVTPRRGSPALVPKGAGDTGG